MEKLLKVDKTQELFGKIFPKVTLVSSSKNRKELLLKCGTKVEVFNPKVNEVILDNIADTVKENSYRKIKAYLETLKDDIVPNPTISADTLVSFEGKEIGKPKNKDDAREMLKSFSGNKHTVYTGCSYIFDISGKFSINKLKTIVVSADVYFKKLSEKEIEDYLDKEEYIGAAGGYRLQESGYTLIDKIDGNWTTVVGLPLEELIKDYKSVSS